MSSMAALGPDNALQLVQLKQLVENVAESAYKGLQDLSQAVPALSDEERYRLELGPCMHTHTIASSISRMATLLTVLTLRVSESVSGTQEACSIAAPARHPTEALASACLGGMVQQSKNSPQVGAHRLSAVLYVKSVQHTYHTP